MGLPDVKLPPIAAIVAGIRAAIAEAAKECRALAEVSPEPIKSQLIAAAVKLESVLDSTELAELGLAALAEARDIFLTGTAPVRHDATDLQ